MTVVVLGTGAIGSAVVRRLLATGHEVTVWNRTPERLTGLVAAGAVAAESVADAVRSGPLVPLTLTDYAAVRDCVGAVEHLAGRTVVAMCTGTADDARDAAARVTGLGGRYLDAGIQASPPDLRGTILYSGDRDAFEEHREILTLLSTPRFVGDPPDAAAVWDLALFGVWYDAQLGVLRALDLVRRAGIDVAGFAETAATQVGHVVAGLPGTLTELVSEEYPAGPATLGEHLTVLHQLVEQRSGSPLGDGGLPAVVRRIEDLIAAGRATRGLTATVHRDGAASG